MQLNVVSKHPPSFVLTERYVECDSNDRNRAQSVVHEYDYPNNILTKNLSNMTRNPAYLGVLTRSEGISVHSQNPAYECVCGSMTSDYHYINEDLHDCREHVEAQVEVNEQSQQDPIVGQNVAYGARHNEKENSNFAQDPSIPTWENQASTSLNNDCYDYI